VYIQYHVLNVITMERFNLYLFFGISKQLKWNMSLNLSEMLFHTGIKMIRIEAGSFHFLYLF